ncbi:MAG: LVIVD repeat protein [Petrotoga mobilis]|nr:MAG: LVIVD repeat protein [Petrotoga mobilis]
MADQNNSENKNENKLEYESLINQEEKKPPQNRERLIIITTIIAIIVLGIVIIFSLLFFGGKYNVTINYEIVASGGLQEPYKEIKVQLIGANTYEASFPVGESIELTSIEEGNYQLNIMAVDDTGLAYYYYNNPEFFVNENKTLNDIKLIKSSLKYQVDYRWVNNDLYITLPQDYEQYFIYRRNSSGIYEPFRTSNQNTIILSSVPSEGVDLKFAVVKNNMVYDFSENYSFQKNSSPNSPIILSPSANQLLTEPYVYFVWQAEDPEGDSLVFDLYLTPDSEQEQLIAENINTYFYQFNSLEMGKNYTLRIVAKDKKGGESTSQIRFSTGVVPQEKVYLYSPSGEMGVTIYEVTNPSNPQEIATIDAPGNVTDVINHDNYLYILRNIEGLSIAEISDPNSPTLLENLNLEGINGIKIANGYLYARFENGQVSVYSIKDNPRNPEFLGYTDIKFYGALEPEIRYIQTQQDLKVEIIKGEYPVRINLNNRVFVTEYSLLVANTEIKKTVENSFSQVFDTLRLIFSTYKPEDFRSNEKISEIENKLLSALNELFNTNTTNGIKEVNLDVSRVE